MLIKQENRDRVVANPNVVVLYNKDLNYRREKISDWGDRCDFLDVAPAILVDSISRFDPSVVDRPDELFRFSSVPVSDEIVVLQQKIFRQLQSDVGEGLPDLGESLLHLVDRVIETLYRCDRYDGMKLASQSRAIKKNRELVDDCKLLLSKRFFQPISMCQIARDLNVSLSHLRRIFKAQTTESIHQYLTKLRLRTSLERVRYQPDLTQVALELGFSSHSHFSAAFRKAFGTSPSRWRRNCRVNSANDRVQIGPGGSGRDDRIE